MKVSKAFVVVAGVALIALILAVSGLVLRNFTRKSEKSKGDPTNSQSDTNTASSPPRGSSSSQNTNQNSQDNSQNTNYNSQNNSQNNSQGNSQNNSQDDGQNDENPPNTSAEQENNANQSNQNSAGTNSSTNNQNFRQSQNTPPQRTTNLRQPGSQTQSDGSNSQATPSNNGEDPLALMAQKIYDNPWPALSFAANLSWKMIKLGCNTISDFFRQITRNGLKSARIVAEMILQIYPDG